MSVYIVRFDNAIIGVFRDAWHAGQYAVEHIRDFDPWAEDTDEEILECLGDWDCSITKWVVD